jgi:molybdopterin converting factor small subunit
MDDVQVRIQLFGAFRKYADGSDVSLEVPRGTTVSALRAYLAEALRRGCPAFDGEGLLELSAVADDERILDDTTPLGLSVDRLRLAILPPVCGG